MRRPIGDLARSRIQCWVAAWRAERDRPPRTVEEIRAEDPQLAKLLEELESPEVRGPEELEPWHDFRRFAYTVKVLAGPWRRFTVHVDAAAWGEADVAMLPSPLRENVETRGRAALQAQLDDNTYPRQIFVDRFGVRAEGQQAVFNPVFWLFGVAIGTALGYGWTRIFGGTVALNSFLGALVFGLVPAYFHKVLRLRHPLIVQPGRSAFDEVPIRRLVLNEIYAWRRTRQAGRLGRFAASIDEQLASIDPEAPCDEPARADKAAGTGSPAEAKAIDRLLQGTRRTDWRSRPNKRTLEPVAAVLLPHERVLGVCRMPLTFLFDCSFTVTDQGIYFGTAKDNECWKRLRESTPAGFCPNERVLRIPLAAVDSCAIANHVFALNLRDKPAITFNVLPGPDRYANIAVQRFVKKAQAVSGHFSE
jgi:hypothetical protein